MIETIPFDPIEQNIIAFVSQQIGDFHLQELLDFLGPCIAQEKQKFFIQDIINCRAFQRMTFTKGLETGKSPELFTPRHRYFQDACFIISPRKEEIAAGVLIPGHRCIPFFNLYGVNPWECTLLTEEGSEVPRKVITCEMGSLIVYHSLLGVENMSDLLFKDQKSNGDAFKHDEFSEKNQIALTVFDLIGLYRKWRFAPEDRMILQVKDWLKGVFTLRRVSQEEQKTLQSQSKGWTAKLEQGFEYVFNIFGVKADIEEQIAYAYYYAGKEILHNPAFHLGGSIDRSERLYLIPFGIETKVWFDKEFTVDQMFAETGGVPKTQGFAGFLESLKSPCSEIEFEAFIRDELFYRKGAVGQEQAIFDAVADRIFGENAGLFSAGRQRELFKGFQKHWKKIAKTYNFFADQTTGAIRRVIVEIMEDSYRWFRELNNLSVQLEDVPIQVMAGIGQICSTFTDYLALLNQYTLKDQFQISQMHEIIPTLNSTLESMKYYVIENVTAGGTKSGFPKLYLVEPSGKEKAPREVQEPKHIFVLQVRVKNIHPHIWRSVQVPGSYTLGDLHRVIQTAMGWTDGHDHEFQINYANFSAVEPTDSFRFKLDVKDENAYTLDMLGLVEKQRFMYMYDFGNNWEHQIVVSGVISAKDRGPAELGIPRCLNGKRACPPEDCGGIFGYADILQALAAPDRAENQDLLKWIQDFDPERFNIDEVNKQLRINSLKGGV